MMSQENVEAGDRAVAPHVRMKMLLQMAEALEDEAGGLYRRASAFEEEEFMLNLEIQERQTEICRLQLKLEALRSTRNGLLEKIESLRTEATAMRQEVFNNEAEIAVAVSASSSAEIFSNQSGDDDRRSSVFFQRVSL